MKITIITPSFNQGAFIERTIHSVLTQNIAELEYLVMDGQSTDHTLKILEKYSHSLRYVSEKDFGQAHAVNKGLQQARGEIIGWLNSDDIYYPGTLKKVLKFFADNPEVDFVYGKAYHIDENDAVLDYYPTENWHIKRLKQTCFISQPAVFFRQDVLNRFGLLNENLNFCMDYEYWLRCGLQGARFAYVPEIFAGSRLHAQTKTCSAPLLATKETLKMMKDQLGYVPTQWLVNDTVLKVKTKTKLRLPQLRFLVAVGLLFVYSCVRWNFFFSPLPPLVLIWKKLYQRERVG